MVVHQRSYLSTRGRPGVHKQRLGFQEGQQSLAPAFPPKARLFETAKGDAEVRADGIVTDRARPESARYLVGPVDVIGEDRVIQSVYRVVGDLDRILFAICWNHREDRPEYLFLSEGRTIVDICKDRRFDEKATLHVRGPAAAGGESSAFQFAQPNVAFNAISLPVCRKRAHLSREFEWVSDLHCSETCA